MALTLRPTWGDVVAGLTVGAMLVPQSMAYAELGSAIPEAGGGYQWVREGLPRPNAFISGWMAWFAHIIAGSRGVEVLVFPARVQGECAVDEVVAGITAANRVNPPVDVLVITRGGGSLHGGAGASPERLDTGDLGRGHGLHDGLGPGLRAGDHPGRGVRVLRWPHGSDHARGCLPPRVGTASTTNVRS